MSVLAADAAGVLDAARAAAADAPVPGCPGWTVDDLVWHVSEVHGFWAHVVRTRAEHPDGAPQWDRPADRDALYQAAADRSAELLAALDGADDDARVWTWADRHDVGWVRRRMLHETAVHRHDAERAAGREQRIDPDVAADGIDEFLAHFLDHRLAETGALTGTVHVHCTDAEGEWMIVPAADGVTVTREHAKGDVALRGDAHDLLLALWRRGDLDAVTVFGDERVASTLVGSVAAS